MLKSSHLLSLFLLALPASAGTTWIVDDDGPADFSNIQDAVDAAAPGDVILVLGGSYPGFVLDTAVTVMGLPAVSVNGPVQVVGVVDGTFAAISNLGVKDLDVADCSSTIVLDEVTFLGGSGGTNSVSVQNSADVRFRELRHLQSFGYLPMLVGAARVEVCDSDLVGFPGKDCSFDCAINPTCIPGNAPPAVSLTGPSSVLHAYRTKIRGGQGGFYCLIPPDGLPGPAVSGQANCEVLLAGQFEHGIAPGCNPACVNTVTLTTGSHARISGVNLVGNVATSGGSTVDFPAQVDPTLHVLSQVGPGENVTFRVIAPLGASVQLNLGRFPALVPISGIQEDLLVDVVRTFDLGPVDANGVAGFNFKLPAFAKSGSVLFGQARVTLPDGSTRYTNSVPVVVR